MITHYPYGHLLVWQPFDVYPLVHALADSHVQPTSVVLSRTHC